MKVITTIDKDAQAVLNKLEKGEIYKFPMMLCKKELL